MRYVLLHGGGFAGSCWERLTPLLDGPADAIDLPGRARSPADLATLRVAHLVEAVVAHLEGEDLADVVLVGHSMAGITIPGVVARTPERLRRVVFVAAVVPPVGGSVIDLLAPEVGTMAADGSASGEPGLLDRQLAIEMFCNDMDDEQTQFTLDRMVPESPGLVFEPVDTSGLGTPVPRTYVRLLKDAAVPLEVQGEIIDRIGAQPVDLDSGHMAMITNPPGLARILSGG